MSVIAVFFLLAGALSVTCAGANDRMATTAISSPWEWDQFEAQSAAHTWTLELVVTTHSLWEVNGACPHCVALTNATVLVASHLPSLLSNAAPKNLLPLVEGDLGHVRQLQIRVGTVDCRGFDGSQQTAFPCGEGYSVPSLRLRLLEGTHRTTEVFRGVGDALGVGTWLQGKLPSTYRLSKPSVTATFPPTKGRSMMSPQSRITRFVAAKDLMELIKKSPNTLFVVATQAPQCPRCAAVADVVDTVHRVVNASRLSNSSITFVRTLVDGLVWQKRWLPEGVESPQILIFLPRTLTDDREQTLPLLYRDAVAPVELLRTVAYFSGKTSLLHLSDDAKRLLMSNEATTSPRVLSSLSSQLVGLKKSSLSEAVHVIVQQGGEAVDDDLAKATTMPTDYDKSPLTPEENDSRLKHMFVTLLVASFTVSTGAAQRELNNFLSIARRYDQANNAVTATFVVIDLSTVDFSVGSSFHKLFVSADNEDTISLVDVCLEPPCLVTCVQARGRHGALTCGNTGLSFNRMSPSIIAPNLEHSLSIVADPASDEEINFKGHDQMSRALENSVALHHADSLRPWFALDRNSDLGKASAEGRRSLFLQALTQRRHLLVLFHNPNPDSAAVIDASRRAVVNFESVCRELNVTTGSKGPSGLTGASSVLCVAIDMREYAQLSHTVRNTFHVPTKSQLSQSAMAKDVRHSPFVAYLGLISADTSLNQLSEIAQDAQRRMILDITPEMLVLRPSEVKSQALLAIGHPPAEKSSLLQLTANTIERTIVDPEKGVLVLFSGGIGCAHSSVLMPTLDEVATAFANERREVAVAVIDATKELSAKERKERYHVRQLPSLVWYPKGVGKSVERSGEPYPGTLQKLQIVEFLNDEMGYSFYEMDWVQETTIPAVTKRDFSEKISGESAINRSHTVLFLYRSLPQDMASLERMLSLQQKFDGHPKYAPQSPLSNDEANVDASPDFAAAKKSLQHAKSEGGVQFFKMDGRRYERFLYSLGLLSRGEAARPGGLPKVIFLPRGPLKLTNFKVATLPDKPTAAGIADKVADIVTIAQFVLQQLGESSMATEQFIFTAEELQIHDDATRGSKATPAVTRSNVHELDMSSFKGFIDDTADVIVYFYASWCSFCKQFGPVFEALADSFRDDSSIQFGKIDVPKNDEVGHMQGILSFPTIKAYWVGSEYRRKYIGHDLNMGPLVRNASTDSPYFTSLREYIKTTRRTSRVAELDHHRQLREKSLVELNGTSLEALWQNGTSQVLVEFFAPWCGHCHTVVPELQAVGEHFRKRHRENTVRPKLIVAKIDVTLHRNVSIKYNATKVYPQIILFTVEKNAKGALVRRHIKFTEHRLADRMVQFVEQHLPAVDPAYDPKTAKQSVKSSFVPPQAPEIHRDDINEASLPKVVPPQVKKDSKRPAKAKTISEKVEEIYASDADQKEVLRKRNAKNPSNPRRSIESTGKFARDVKFLTEGELTVLLDTPRVVAVLHCESNLDDEYIDVWNIVTQSLGTYIKRNAVVVGVVEAGDSSPILRNLLGEAPSITVFRGLGTPQSVRYKMLDPIEDFEAFSKTRFGEGGSGTNATEVTEFIRRQVLSAVANSVEITHRLYENITQNMTAKVMVMFYAPWSKESQVVAPSYDALAQKFLHINNVFITRVDISGNRKLYEKMHRQQLPLILVYDDVPGLPAVFPEARKLPRRLKVAKPSREQLAHFLLNDEQGIVLDQEVFVPYGDEDVTPAVPFAKESASQQNRPNGARREEAPTRRWQLADAVYPLELFSVQEAEGFVQQYAATTGALLYFSSSWCKACPLYANHFVAAANKIILDVAVAILNITRLEEATLLKKSPLLATNQFPSFSLFVTTSDDDSVLDGAESALQEGMETLTGGKTEAPRIKRVDFKEKQRSDGGASLLRFVADHLPSKKTRTHDATLPVYETQQARNKRINVGDGSKHIDELVIDPSSGTTIGKHVAVLDSVKSANETIAPYLEGRTSAPQALVVVTDAKWCPIGKCGAALYRKVNLLSDHTASLAHTASNVKVAVADLTTKEMKQWAQQSLHSAAVPSCFVVCNGTRHRCTSPSSPTALAEIMELLDEQCFGLMTLAAIRARLSDAVDEIEDGEVREMSLESVISYTTGSNAILAMQYDQQKCSKNPECHEAKRILRKLSGSSKNKQLLFALVDMSSSDNQRYVEEKKKQSDSLQLTAAVKLIYFPVEAPPVAFEGYELTRESLQLFIDEEERKSRDSRRL